MGALRIWAPNSFAESGVRGSERHWRLRKPLLCDSLSLCLCENGGFGNWIFEVLIGFWFYLQG